ncbi:VOC family protein [Pilimelia columellifera]|uniref:VOC family protein n=1 Tax=Pilimelia columellifera subsp. columellifera TaxID=706583 RepID=A0ABN3N8T5_9ACTN
MQKIKPCLWFDTQAMVAAEHYTSIFPDSKILDVVRYTEAGPGEPGTVLTVTFQIAGQELMALNGGPRFTFTEAISLSVDCQDQEELDDLWSRLGADGDEGQCGWIRDRFGLWWQLVPTAINALLRDGEPARTARMMTALLGMRKLDIRALQDAYDA